MATFFGEVILPSSRAFFDEKDDSDYDSDDCDKTVPRNPVIADVKNEAALNGTFDLIIVSDGSIARDFILNYLAGQKEVICEFAVASEQETSDEIAMIYSKKLSVKPKTVATLYKIESGPLYLEAKDSLKMLNANYLTLSIISYLEKCKDVLIFASRSSSDYKGDRNESVPQNFVKSLATSTCLLPSTCQPMEQPNFISGVAASVMSWCQVKSKNCTLHVCYSDALFNDSVTLTPFLKCLTGTPQAHLIRTKAPEHLKHNNPVHLNVMYQ